MFYKLIFSTKLVLKVDSFSLQRHIWLKKPFTNSLDLQMIYDYLCIRVKLLMERVFNIGDL